MRVRALKPQGSHRRVQGAITHVQLAEHLVHPFLAEVLRRQAKFGAEVAHRLSELALGDRPITVAIELLEEEGRRQPPAVPIGRPCARGVAKARSVSGWLNRYWGTRVRNPS
jgi:hypothetical protein